MRQRIAIGILIAAFAIAACGGDGDGPKQRTQDAATRTVAVDELARRYDAAVNRLNSSIRVYNARVSEDAASNNLEAMQADTSRLRDAFFNFDSTIRDLAFPSSMREDVNRVLDATRIVIADLDAIGSAKTLAEAGRLLRRFQDDKAQEHDPATNELVDELVRAKKR